ncbi:MAG: PadR family transcriptional regulator [Actinomycetota bacterium]|nr:PadR family transcriptional regulator [Actinomycetota bacterium]
MAKRGGAVELAVLGLLHEAPMHGYELRKRVSALLGWGRVLSYGSLYPALKQMRRAGWLTEDVPAGGKTAGKAMGRTGSAKPTNGRRGKIVYKLTAEGKERFEDLMSHGGPSAWEDDSFGVHFAFFSRTDAETRMRILEGRRTRMEERLERIRTSFARSRERVDAYTLELQRHGLESVEREVSWLKDLIDDERSRRAPTVRRRGAGTGEAADARRADRPDDLADNSEE